MKNLPSCLMEELNISRREVEMDYTKIYGGYEIVHEEVVLLAGLRDDIKPGGLSTNVTFLTDSDRRIFFSVFLLILGLAVFGNAAAIYAMKIRKCRFLQKSCIVSLAVSDMTMAIAYGINNMETFSHPQINWTLGAFMCSFIPFLQMLGITASTSAMVTIALDRYRNVVHATSYRWNPKPSTCIIGFCTMWVLCIVASCPIYNMFELKLSWIVFLTGPSGPYIEPMNFCVSLVKHDLMTYYACMAALIFTTLFVIFIWLYINIAKLVWTHRKPPQCRKYLNESSTNETSITYIKSSDSQNQQMKPQLTKAGSIHVERKIRTFKIIICLMLVFFICRIPFWAFNIIKLVGYFNEPKHWVLTYIFNALALLNCALNPFLYTFLNQTLQAINKINRGIANFTCDICCCCFNSSDFDHFERENPFVVNNGNESPRLVGSYRIPKVRLKDGQIVDAKQTDLRKY